LILTLDQDPAARPLVSDLFAMLLEAETDIQAGQDQHRDGYHVFGQCCYPAPAHRAQQHDSDLEGQSQVFNQSLLEDSAERKDSVLDTVVVKESLLNQPSKELEQEV
jgi:hypothetical protein